MKVSHEAPLSLMEFVSQFNDYEYALIHLLENDNYGDYFIRALGSGKEVYLDNSLFELGSSLEDDLCVKWLERLKPTYFVIPDAFSDKDFTAKKMRKWAPLLRDMNIKSIGVLQGKTIDDFFELYDLSLDLCDMTAVSFAQPLFESMYPTLSKDIARMHGRVRLIDELEQRPNFSYNQKIHLLGLSLPQELLFYKNKEYIYSVDSSSPVIHGVMGVEYDSYTGLKSKNETKVNDIFNDPFGEEYLPLIEKNIRIFKKFIE